MNCLRGAIQMHMMIKCSHVVGRSVCASASVDGCLITVPFRRFFARPRLLRRLETGVVAWPFVHLQLVADSK